MNFEIWKILEDNSYIGHVYSHSIFQISLLCGSNFLEDVGREVNDWLL